MQMKTYPFFFLLLVVILSIASCSKDGIEVDNQKPEIDLSFNQAFPQNCDTLYFGEPFTFNVKFVDNIALGSYSIDIHNNFDHHSHSTEVSECSPDLAKSPVNPLVFIQDYSIPTAAKLYEANFTITLSASNSVGVYDEGDYHFLISLTDKSGWSTQKGLSVKILQR
jgi:hypothetical protein